MKLPRLLLFAVAMSVGVPVAAQQTSQGYKFLEAVEKEDGNTVTNMLDTPGSSVVNAKQVTSGKAALHLLVTHSGSLFFQFMLQRGADPNIRDDKGNTPMVLAALAGREDLVRLLLTYKANPNLGNAGGQTPLILAVANRDVPLARLLLTEGANPDQTDNLAGMSARDYAKRDARNPILAQLLATAPKTARRATVAGPKF
ncbi:ankyrin repeat domain-containing protein [Sphingomonas oligophenolica]|uniref:Ankyrin repeat domain-containing protein n=1 Tax=Sphingomonas oligophenolica TaxID=301154 RepID=A0A502CRX8_9SPHN|nr:ankyrin repeat domain-containing protein [Sphingomonas oligophenolica]TPG15593.1 ankyrin repeat domain-containing protein [Sphingomonas oligophenolica]